MQEARIPSLVGELDPTCCAVQRKDKKNWGFQVTLVVKNLPANAGDKRDTGPIPGLGRSSGGEHGNPLWYSCLENPMDRSLVGHSPWGLKESNTAEATQQTHVN